MALPLPRSPRLSSAPPPPHPPPPPPPEGKSQRTPSSRNQPPFNSFCWGKGCSRTGLISAFYTSRSRDKSLTGMLLINDNGALRAHHRAEEHRAQPTPSSPTHHGTGAVGWQQRFPRPACIFRMRDPTGLLWPERVPQVLDLGLLQTLPYNRRMAEGSGSSSLCPGTTAPGRDPPVPQTRCRGSPEKKPQTFGMTEVHGPDSPQEHHTPLAESSQGRFTHLWATALNAGAQQCPGHSGGAARSQWLQRWH